jgi:hypothetical protein
VNFEIQGYQIDIDGLAAVATLLVGLAGLAILIVPFVRIVQRTGYSGWWFLLWFVPVANILALWYFAFGPWPAFDEDATDMSRNKRGAA